LNAADKCFRWPRHWNSEASGRLSKHNLKMRKRAMRQALPHQDLFLCRSAALTTGRWIGPLFREYAHFVKKACYRLVLVFFGYTVDGRAVRLNARSIIGNFKQTLCCASNYKRPASWPFLSQEQQVRLIILHLSKILHPDLRRCSIRKLHPAPRYANRDDGPPSRVSLYRLID